MGTSEVILISAINTLYSICYTNSFNDISISSTAATNIANQQCLITDTAANLGAAGAPDHVYEYDFGNGKKYYLYLYNEAGVRKYTIASETLVKLQEYSGVQAGGGVATDKEKLEKFIENIIIIAARIKPVAANIFNTIHFRYNLTAHNINEFVTATEHKTDLSAAPPADQYQSMIDNCYYSQSLQIGEVANINSVIISGNKMAFCHLNHNNGILSVSDNIRTHDADFVTAKLNNMIFIQDGHNNPPTLLANNVNAESIDQMIKLTYKVNLNTTYDEEMRLYLGCSCMGYYDDDSNINCECTAIIKHEYNFNCRLIMLFESIKCTLLNFTF
jgi:hypothetical protein